jgi:nucleotidyltransferase substrate binding protein (TIGR01987 family)
MLTKKESQLQDLQTAAKRLKEALEKEKDDIVRDAVIQRFEFTFELTWKTILTVLRENDIEFRGVKTVFRDAARIGLLDDVEEWFSYLEARNLTTHTYDLEIAEKVYQKAKGFSKAIEILLPKLAQ